MSNDYYAWPEVISNWVDKATVAIAESMNEALKEAIHHWELSADSDLLERDK